MGYLFFHSLMTFIDLAALSSVVGTVICLYWTVCPVCISGEASDNTCFDRCLRLFYICLAGLSISSAGMLFQRTMEMAGVGIADSIEFLPVVLLQSHYGTMWIVRIGSIVIAWCICLLGRKHLDSGLIIVMLLLACAAISFSRSASSHAADYGDLSLQQLADWLHLMAACAWGGALMSMSLMLSPAGIAENPEQQHTVAGMADKFYAFFGPVFAILIATGLYSAWVEVRSWEALFSTVYGRLLAVKLLILAGLTFRYIAPPRKGKDEAAYAVGFIRRTRIEAFLILSILLCVALFTHEIPARHAMHLMPGPEHKMDQGHDPGQEHGMSHHMEHGHGM